MLCIHHIWEVIVIETIKLGKIERTNIKKYESECDNKLGMTGATMANEQKEHIARQVIKTTTTMRSL